MMNFFALVEQDTVQSGDVDLHLDLTKGEALVTLEFSFKGNVTLTCDRSLDEFDYKIDFEKELFLSTVMCMKSSTMS